MIATFSTTGDQVTLCFIIVCLPLQLPDFNALFLVSLLAAVMSISYSTIGWVSAVAEGQAAEVSYAILGGSTAKLMGIFNGLGTMVFAYGNAHLPGCNSPGFAYSSHAESHGHVCKTSSFMHIK